MPELSTLLHYEDFAVGDSRDFGSYQVTAEEIKSFAREFDPQPFHLDEEEGKASVLGGLSASGWHTCAMLMRMMVDGYLGQSASLGSPGLDELKWLKPVYPGETLAARYTVLSKRVSAKRRETGIVTMRWQIFSTAGEMKMEVTGVNLIKVRSP
jgi:acyl dehydratase